MSEKIIMLVTMASQFLSLPAPLEPPIVEYVPQSFLQDKICSGKDCKVEALHESGKIYMSNTTKNKKEVMHDSILLHEIVHFVQFKNGKILNTCEGLREMEDQAYALQEFFLNDNGVYLGGPLRFGAMELNCSDNR